MIGKRYTYRYFVAAAALLIFCQGVAGEKTETGFLNRSVNVGGVEYRYQVYVPREFSRGKKWPVIVALHGGGEYGSDGLRQTNVGLAPAIRRDPARFPALVIFPQAKNDNRPGWQLDGGRAAMAALDRALKEFNGDGDRVVLTGYSAGGNGTWFLASRYPDRFAAIVPVCAFVSEFRGRSTPVLYPALAPGDDPYSAVAAKVSRIPVWMFHGARDDVVLPDESRKMNEALKKLNANVRYTELPNANHNAWDPAYGNKDLIEWMLNQRRPAPRKR